MQAFEDEKAELIVIATITAFNLKIGLEKQALSFLRECHRSKEG